MNSDAMLFGLLLQLLPNAEELEYLLVLLTDLALMVKWSAPEPI